jgi:ribosomal protein L21E
MTRFRCGDKIVPCPLYDNKKPNYGTVIEEGEEAIVQWSREEYLSHSKFREKEQFDIWNGNPHSGYRLFKRGFLKQAKKAKKYKVGDLVEIIKKGEYVLGLNHVENLSGEIGIITDKLMDEIYVQIYLQEQQKYVWREISEIRKA